MAEWKHGWGNLGKVLKLNSQEFFFNLLFQTNFRKTAYGEKITERLILSYLQNVLVWTWTGTLRTQRGAGNNCTCAVFSSITVLASAVFIFGHTVIHLLPRSEIQKLHFQFEKQSGRSGFACESNRQNERSMGPVCSNEKEEFLSTTTG